MKAYHAALAIVLALLLGWVGVGDAAGPRGHAHGGGHGFHHGGGASGFHRGHGGFHGHPGFRGRAFLGVAPFFFWGPGYVYAPPPVVEAPAAGYWYYCPSARAYYPYVQACPEPWVPVPAS